MESNTTTSKMRYRYLGNSGIQVSVLGWGNWINTSDSENIMLETVKLCLESGINFFDTAEIYGNGEGETSLGKAFKSLDVRRESIVVSTKIFKCGTGINDSFLSRKHIIEGLRNSLKRLQLEYVDVVFCHRYDLRTPIEEVCRAMNWVIEKGWAFYWGTSEWDASQIMEAHVICEKLGLIKPICDQCQYNMFVREKLETQYVPLFDKIKLGTTIWSPLFSGVLTGKYINEIPKDTRFDLFSAGSAMHLRTYNNNKKEWDEKLIKLTDLAKSLGCNLAQLAIAWTIRNPDVSTCILGTSRVEQLVDNLGALEIVDKLTTDVELQIEEILQNQPIGDMDWRYFTRLNPRRVDILDKKK